MRHLILLLAACSAWGQIAITYANNSGVAGVNTATLNSVSSGFGVVFTAPTATSVTGLSLYSTARATANVDALTANVYEMSTASLGITVTYTDASDLVNATAHNFQNGDTLRFNATTTLPAGILINTTYYVCNRTDTTIQIDDDSGCGSIVTDFSGSAGTQLAAKLVSSSTTFSPSPVTAATWVDFSSFSAHTLVAGRRYAAMLNNTEAVPATDSITMAYMDKEAPTLVSQVQGSVSGGLIVSVASAQGFALAVSSRSTGYVELASGVKIGNSVITNESSSNMRINGTRRVGSRFTVPSNISYNVNRLGFQTRGSSNTSTQPKTLTLELYSIGAGTDTLVDSCDISLSVAASAMSPVAGWCYRSSSSGLTPGGHYRLVATAGSGAGDASNYIIGNSFLFRSGQTVDIPLSIQATYCAATCTTTANWTDETAKTSSLLIGLDDTTPYAPVSGGVGGGSFVVAQ